MQLERDSDPKFVKALQDIEDRADVCRDNLELYLFPRAVASWAVLVSLVVTTERLRQEKGFKNYDVNFLLRLMTKDLLYAQNEATHCNVNLKTAEVARSLFEVAIAQGFGNEDMSSVIEPLRNK